MIDPSLEALADTLVSNGADEKPLAVRGALQRGLAFEPDAYAAALRTAAKTGFAPSAVLRDPAKIDARATAFSLAPEDLVALNPRTAAWLVSHQDNAALAHDDLETLRKSEALAQLSDPQRRAVLEDQVRMSQQNAGTDEATSFLAGNIHGLLSPLMNLARKAAPFTLGGLIDSQVTQAAQHVQPFLDWIQGRKTWDEANAAAGQMQADYNPFQPGALTAWQMKKADQFMTHESSLVKQGPAYELRDESGKSFINPVAQTVKGDWGTFQGLRDKVVNPLLTRNTLNSVEAIPGTMAAFAVGGEAAPFIFSYEAAESRMNQALQEGADPSVALAEGFGSGLLNLALMTKVPQSVPTRTITGTAAQIVGRGTLLGSGMTVGENLLARLHDPNRDLTEGLAGNVATFTAFDLAGPALSLMGEVAEQSKLRKRSPGKFQEAVQLQLDGSPVAEVRMPVRAFQALFQDPISAAERLGARGYADAVEGQGSGDVTIPSAALVTELGAKVKDALADCRTLNPATGEMNGPTPREQAEYVQNGGPEKVKAAFQKMEQEAQGNPDFKVIRDELKARFVAQGETEAVASDYASQMAMAFMNASRAGLSPLEYFRYRNPDIQIRNYEESYGEEAQAGGRGGAGEAGAGAGFGEFDPERDLFQPRRYDRVEDIPQGTHFQGLDSETRAKVTEAIENDIRSFHADPEGFFQAYDALKSTQGGRLVNSDIVYSMLPTVARNLHLGHTAGGSLDLGLLSHLTTLRNHLVGRAIDKAGDLPVAITAGGQASGKTTYANWLLKERAVGAVIDAPHDDAKTVEPIVRKILAAGKEAEIVFLHRPDMKASEHSNIKRAILEGRYVEPQWRGDTTAKVPGEMLKLGEMFRNQPRVGLWHTTNMESGGFIDVGGRLHEGGKDAMTSIRNLRTPSSEELAQSASEAYNDYLKGVSDGNPAFPAIPADLRARIEASHPQRPVQGSGGEGATHGSDQAPERGAFQGLPGPVAESLRSLGIDPEGIQSEASLRRALDRAEARPETREAARALRKELEGGTLFQAGPMDFGSKEWNEYYGLRHGSRAKGDQAKRAKESMQKALTKKGYTSFDDLREAELRDQAERAAMFEGEGGQPRGWFRVRPDGTFEMGRTKIGDLSTFVHEPGHAYLVMLGDMAGREGASEQLKADYQTAREYLGAEEGQPLTRDQQETWARTIEAYVREGKAPTPGLRGVFQRLSIWLGSVYRKATSLGVDMTPEVREVLDRWFAASDAVDQVAKDFGERQLFKTPEEAGLSPEQFREYAESRGLEVEDAKQQILREMNEAVLRERTDAWREEERNTRTAVEEIVNARPEYVAMKTLRMGEDPDGNPIQMNRDLLIQEFGAERVKALQALHNGLYRTEGGTDAQTAAELLGYRSGEELMRALEDAPRRKDLVDQETKARMVEKYGDIRWDGTLTDQARIALANERMADNLFKEIQALQDKAKSAQENLDAKRRAVDAKLQNARDERRARGQAARVTGLPQMREAAREAVEEKAIAALAPADYLNASRRYSREAYQESLKGRPLEARDAKVKELQNLFLYMESRKITQEAEKSYQYMTKFGRKAIRERIAKAGGEYGQHAFLDQIDGLLEQFEFKRRTNLELSQSLDAFVKDLAAKGEAVAIDPSLARMKPRNYRSLTIRELRAVTDAVKNLETLARNEGKVLDGEKRADKETAIQEMDAAARASLKQRPKVVDEMTAGLGERISRTARNLDTGIQKIERVIDWLDGGNINGPWRRLIFDPIAKAQYKETELMERVTNRLAAAMEQMPKDHRMSLLDTFSIPELGAGVVERGQPTYPAESVTRKFILSVALNWGNASNREKLLHGMKWADRPQVVDRMFSHLTAEDWHFVQGVWNTLGDLWPEIEALELRTSGVAPERIAFDKFQVHTADGQSLIMDGGYYPVVYDPSKSTQGAWQADMELMKHEGGEGAPVTYKGHTVSRVEKFSALLQMDFERVLTTHVSKVIKDLSHREAAQSIAKLLNDQRVRDAVNDTLGKEYEAMFKPWLKGTVNDVGTISPDAKGWQKALMAARSNMVVAGLSFRASSVLVQITDFGRASVEVDAKYLMPAMWEFGKRRGDLVREVRNLSKEMADRPENLDRDVRSMWRRLQGKDGAYAKAQKIGLEGLAVADTVTSVTTWKGAYDQALAKGSSQSDAVRIADRTVRMVCMSGAPKDQVALQRVNDVGLKLVTMYMGDATATYGMMTNAFRNILAGKNVAKSAWTMALVGMLLPVMGDLIKNRGPKDDEDKVWWATKKALFNLPSSIPIVRDLSTALETGQDYKFTPLANTINKALKAAALTPKLIDGTVEWDDYFLHAMDAFGGVAGIPGTSQLATSTDYLRRVASGEEQPDTFLGAAINTVLGKPKK